MKTIARSAIHALLAVLLLASCSSDDVTSNAKARLLRVGEAFASREYAAIYNIGEDSTLVFKKGELLVIPIRGRGLNDPDLDISLSVTATVPLKVGHKSLPDPDAPAVRLSAISYDLAEIEIPGSYTELFEDKDQIAITIGLKSQFLKDTSEALARIEAAETSKSDAYKSSLQDLREQKARIEKLSAESPDIYGSIERDIHEILRKQESIKEHHLTGESDAFESIKILSGETRTRISNTNARPEFVPSYRSDFVLREISEYRKAVATTRVPYSDIRAFPMPSDTVEEIFGSLVDRHFYVIALRVYNHSSDHQVITTGMIAARGRVVVVPVSENQAIYSIPVEITPQRLSLVYSFVDGEHDSQKREWIFRSLEFVGALATSASTAFGASKNLIEGLAIFTGIFIPEGKKLWPDSTPRYLSNLVNFGMPDLIKVPTGSSAGGVIFISKKELHSLAADVGNSGLLQGKVQHAGQFIGSIQVDALDIFFEEIETKNEKRSDLNALENDRLRDLARSDLLARAERANSDFLSYDVSISNEQRDAMEFVARANSNAVKITEAAEGLDIQDGLLDSYVKASADLKDLSERLGALQLKIHDDWKASQDKFKEVYESVLRIVVDIWLVTDADERERKVQEFNTTMLDLHDRVKSVRSLTTKSYAIDDDKKAAFDDSLRQFEQLRSAYRVSKEKYIAAVRNAIKNSDMPQDEKTKKLEFLHEAAKK